MCTFAVGVECFLISYVEAKAAANGGPIVLPASRPASAASSHRSRVRLCVCACVFSARTLAWASSPTGLLDLMIVANCLVLVALVVVVCVIYHMILQINGSALIG
jgi:hypothetical protein